MPSQRQQHVFGPVPSRRLGRSLGVDLVPFKTCSYDCIYCQLGHTTCKTVERKAWVPMDAVLAELKPKLASRPDYITLSGSGEPTLHSRLGEIIEHIQAMTDVPVAVLTNGSLLWQKEVRAAVGLADVVLPSLDAPDPERFEFINRPHRDITFERLMEGLETFRREFSGEYWLEVMLLEGYTTLPPQVQQFARLARRIRPDKVQLNTAVRPPADEYAMAIPPERLAALARCFKPRAEVIAEYRGRGAAAESQPSRQAILALLHRRPCSADDVAQGLGTNPGAAVKSLASLAAEGRVRCSRRGAEIFYRAVGPASSPDARAVPGESRRTTHCKSKQ
jgi:wyosine [tRNA(Phe)-imidazoG37] synthetase (radical SAM superfamily)